MAAIAFSHSYAKIPRYVGEPNLDPPEYDLPTCVCCKSDLASDEVIYDTEDGWLCEDCAWELLRLNNTRAEILEQFYECKVAGEMNEDF